MADHSDIKTNYIGIHTWEIPQDHSVTLALKVSPPDGRRYDHADRIQWSFAHQLLYNPIFTLIKTSALVFLRRLNVKSRFVSYLIWSAMAMVIGLSIGVFFAHLFQCSPIAYAYDLSIDGGECVNRGELYVTSAALNLLTDVLVLSIPVLIFRHIRMPLRQKVAFCSALCLGLMYVSVTVWLSFLMLALVQQQLAYGACRASYDLPSRMRTPIQLTTLASSAP